MNDTAILLLIVFILSIIMSRLIFGSYGKHVSHWANIPIWYILIMEIPLINFTKVLAFYFAIHFIVWAVVKLMNYWVGDSSNKTQKEVSSVTPT
jgi:hypothetical protein